MSEIKAPMDVFIDLFWIDTMDIYSQEVQVDQTLPLGRIGNP